MSQNERDSRIRGYHQYYLDELEMLAPQSRILKNWKPVEYIGKGAYARVFRVVNRVTGEDGVIKYIPTPRDPDECCRKGTRENEINVLNYEAGKREAQIMTHFAGDPRIVQYLEEPEFIEHEFVGRDGFPVIRYIVLICMPLYISNEQWMEDISGSVEEKLQVGIDIAQALCIFEKKGIYHRDIKPENILRDKSGHFCLSDVGEAKMADDSTTIGFHGTKPYMAPEVYNLTGDELHHSDHRSDIYSLGVVMYRLFNDGQFPFLDAQGKIVPEAQHYKEALEGGTLTDGECARRLRYGGVSLPVPSEADKELSAVIFKACAFGIEERYQSASELMRALLKYQQGCMYRNEPSTFRMRREEDEARIAQEQMRRRQRAEAQPAPQQIPSDIPQHMPQNIPQHMPQHLQQNAVPQPPQKGAKPGRQRPAKPAGEGALAAVASALNILRKKKPDAKPQIGHSGSVLDDYDPNKVIPALPSSRNAAAVPAHMQPQGSPPPMQRPAGTPPVQRPAGTPPMQRPAGTPPMQRPAGTPSAQRPAPSVQPRPQSAMQRPAPVQEPQQGAQPDASAQHITLSFSVDTQEERFTAQHSFDSAMRIGRGEECQLKLKPRYISRQHIEIQALPDGLFMRNLSYEKSESYTRLRGMQVGERLIPVRSGDLLEIAHTRITITIVSMK